LSLECVVMAQRAVLLAALLGLLCVSSVLAAKPKNLVFTIIGDWGVPNLPYTNVMAQVSTAKNSQFTLAIGDNFYKGITIGGTQHGVTGTDDPKWKTVFENQFPQPFFHKPWYVLAGNHDYDGNEKAQVEYTKLSKRWNFPSLYYEFVKKSKTGGSVQFFMTDSHVLWSGDSALASSGRKKDLKQLKWLERELKKSKATWKIVLGHHPIYTSKGSKEWLVKKVVPLFEKYKVAAYINGHMHTFQHMKSPKLSYLTVGSTGIQGTAALKKVKGVKHIKTYPTKEQDKSAECANSSCRGFAVVTVKNKKNLVLGFYNTKGQLVYSARIKNPASK